MNFHLGAFLRTIANVTIFLITLDSSTEAGEIDSRLQTVLSQGDPGIIYSTIVVLNNKVDLNRLKADFIQSGADRRTRHEIVINSLREKAEETQSDLINFLSTAKGNGVVSYRSYWILNAIAVEGRAEFISDLANHQAVEKIYWNEPVKIIQSVGSILKSDPINVTHIAEQGILDLNVRPLWNMGITGEGEIVMNIDGGVESDHPALASRWRGADPAVDSSAAWFDPATHSRIPYDALGPFDGSWHGTHTMGTITGLEEDADPDTIGVAWGAKWIAALAITHDDSEGPEARIAFMIESFQWGIDPDSLPETIDDVPRVISNSWSWNYIDEGHCKTFFDGIIDAAETAGVAVVFAAGNDGPGPKTMGSPAGTIASPINVFSVGALEIGSEIVTSFSSRGPSGCDDQTIKPEVMARGSAVRSAMGTSGYQNLNGTSMATPHVAGVIALLGQAFPEAIVDELKYAIYETTVDLGVKGEDNDYGNGRVDAYAAYLYLKYGIDINGYIVEFYLSKSNVRPGIDSVEVTARLLSDSSGFNVYAELITSSGSLLDRIELFDDGSHNDGMAGDSVFGNILVFSSDEEQNYRVDLEFQLSFADTDTLIFSQKNQGIFTSIGPVSYESNEIVLNNGSLLFFDLNLINLGSSSTASNISAEISTLDSCVTDINSGLRSFGDIAAGATAKSTGRYSIGLNQNCVGTILLNFNLAVSSNGLSFWSDNFEIQLEPIGVADDITGLPSEYALSEAYPNPFNPITTIKYALPKTEDVSLIIYNLIGQEIIRIVGGVQQAGYHKVTWNASNVSSGIYFYRLAAGDFVSTKKMVLLK